MTWFSLLVLIPLVRRGGHRRRAAAGTATSTTLTNAQTWAALKLTVGQSLLVTAVNVVIGTVDRLGAGP